MKRLLLIIGILAVSLPSLNAQSSQQVLTWINSVQGDNHDFYHTIPFEYRNNEIVIKVTIRNKVYDYIFDTGGYNNVTDQIQSENNFPILASQTVGSSNKLKAKVNLVNVDTLKIGPLVFRNVAALQMNFDNSPTIKCTINGALIGASLIKNYVWQIDYLNKIIIVTDQVKRLSNLDSAYRIPVTFNSRMMPYVKAMINGREQRLMFDLGSSSLFVLKEKEAKPFVTGKETIDLKGGRTEGGNGIVVQKMKIFKADSVKIGLAKFIKKPVLVMSTVSESLIGNPIIKDFIVTLNFTGNELYLTPIDQSPPEDGWITFGFGMAYEKNRVIVTTVYEGLAADKAGVMINDEIVAINGKEVKYSDQCESIQPLAALLNSTGDLTLTIVRNGVKINKRVSKERVF